MKLKNYLYKKFSLNLSSNGGRNRMGRITLPHRGSKCALRRKFINLDLKYSVYNLDYVLLQIKSVSRRTAYAGLILYKNGLFSYILIENTSKIGTVWSSDYFRNYKMGDFFKLLRYLLVVQFIILN